MVSRQINDSNGCLKFLIVMHIRATPWTFNNYINPLSRFSFAKVFQYRIECIPNIVISSDNYMHTNHIYTYEIIKTHAQNTAEYIYKN